MSSFILFSAAFAVKISCLAGSMTDNVIVPRYVASKGGHSRMVNLNSNTMGIFSISKVGPSMMYYTSDASCCQSLLVNFVNRFFNSFNITVFLNVCKT